MHHLHRGLSTSAIASLASTRSSLPKKAATRRCISSLNPDVDTNSEDDDSFPPSSSKVNIAEIGDCGAHITLNFEHVIQSTYHASWLWSNDPKRVTLPSGQRKCTPGQWRFMYGQPSIKSANIIHCKLGRKGALGSSFELKVPGPTPNDCCHPLAIYGTSSSWTFAESASSNDANVRPYLQIDWTIPANADVTDASSIFDIEWLKRFRYDDAARIKRREKTEIQPIHAIRRSGPPLRYSSRSIDRSINDEHYRNTPKHEKDGLVHVNYHSVVGSDGQMLESGLLDLLDAVFRDGAAVVSNTPLPNNLDSNKEDDFPVANIAKAMSGGSLSHGALYDNIFHVREGEANSKNVAYTSVALCPHQDLAYYESPPGIQLLHCVAMGKGVVGGESTLVDAMAAAYRLRELRPKSFEYLVKCPATFVKQRDGACMTYHRPHIVLAEEGHKAHLFDREIVAVHWSPPFEGPVLLHQNDIDRYYQAYADFEQMTDNSLSTFNDDSKDLRQYANEHTWERKLAPGEILVFNNRRMLHGRRAFSVQPNHALAESQRHLVGCYINIDDTLNRYRVLLRNSEDASATQVMNVCNGTSITP